MVNGPSGWLVSAKMVGCASRMVGGLPSCTVSPAENLYSRAVGSVATHKRPAMRRMSRTLNVDMAFR